MGTDVSGVVDDKFVQGETTHLSLSVGTPERYKIRTNRDDLLVIGCLTFRELLPHLFHPKSEADDQGTRFLARIFNSPQGVRLFVSVEEIDLSTNRRRRSRLAFVHDVTERGSGGHFRIPR